ncbi:unnamed protein product [Cercopithifilaria johnstoni]|uniref:LIM/homeobox protein Awh n=1 Tax=Cercopithifilaria johnstoni TaxID=2874296 RepID=A0A8J2Q9N6_9BILA|nr:unnamed protein product [Cercopithifilaria johnstoni]
MEIHHRLYEKSINYNPPNIATANDLLPVLSDTNDTSGISENSNFSTSTSSLVNNSGTFVSLGRSTTLNMNEFPSYSNTTSTGLLDHQTIPNLSLDLTTTVTSQVISVVAETSSETKNNLNGINHHHHQQCHQQQQQFRRTLPLQNAENNVCAVVGTLTTSSLQTDHTNTTMVITNNNSSNSNRSGNDGVNGSSNNSNCSCATTTTATTTTNEQNFPQRNSKFKVEICSLCSEFILDRTLLTVNSRFWHINCLKCSQCSILLEQYSSCFVKDNHFFCIQCYNRRFGTKCSSCQRLIHATDWVRRARNFVYHLACFACDQCKRQLSTGEEFALQDCRLLCKQHYMELIEGECGQQKAKTKRVRTTFAEEQLTVLQTHFQIDSNPDGADLERIAAMTGLSKRVTQVWFQNSRARQKKCQGSKRNRTSHNNSSGRSSTNPCSTPKSPSGDSIDGMIFPTSVLTSVEDAMVATEQRTIQSDST